MEILSIVLARSIALLDVGELNPRGKTPVQNLVPLLRHRFAFQMFPTKPEDFQASEGIEFKLGYFEGQAVPSMTIYLDGIKVDLLSSTEDAQMLLQDTLKWLASEIDVKYSEGMLRRWAFLSQITYRSDIDIDELNPALEMLGQNVSNPVNDRTDLAVSFRVSQVTLDYDRTYKHGPISAFAIERRAKTPFEEEKYYSSAPLQTSQHIRVLEELEDALRKNKLDSRMVKPRS